MMSGDPPSRAPVFLFSVDLEDVRSMVEGGFRYPDRVRQNVGRLLACLDRHGARCTFFVVGELARRHPSLVREIAAAGHEIACHSSDHVPLDRHSPASFRRDLEQNLDDLDRAGAGEVSGFRAPLLSLTAETAWAYGELARLGFTYSSSVLPARSPLYGWPGFHPEAQRVEAGLWEIPVTTTRLPLTDVPLAGGVYLRLLPFVLLRYLFRRRLAAGKPMVGYLHPYDVDAAQDRLMHPGLGGNRLLNALIYVSRERVPERLEGLLKAGAAVVPYRDYVADHLATRD